MAVKYDYVLKTIIGTWYQYKTKSRQHVALFFEWYAMDKQSSHQYLTLSPI